MVSTPQIDSNLRAEKPTPNNIFGQITNLIYQESGGNLVEVKIQGINSNFDDVFTFTAYCNVSLDYKTIRINNLNEFQFRLQEAFNYQFLVRIFHESNEIRSIEISRFNQSSFTAVARSVGSPPGGTSPLCPPWC